jgi:hypothetical protein
VSIPLQRRDQSWRRAWAPGRVDFVVGSRSPFHSLTITLWGATALSEKRPGISNEGRYFPWFAAARTFVVWSSQSFLLVFPLSQVSAGKQRTWGKWHGSCSLQSDWPLRILQERWSEVLWRVQLKVNTTCILPSLSFWLAWVLGPFWLLSSVRNKEPHQRGSIAGEEQRRCVAALCHDWSWRPL